MTVSIEFAPLAPQADAASASADLIVAMEQGLMSQLDLMGHVQHLESLGELRAAANLYALWINHAKATDKHFALFNFGGILQNLQRPHEALEAYAACVALKEEFPQPYINLGLLYEKLGQDALALQTWLRLVSRRYLDKPPTDEFLTMALNHIGRLQEKLKNYAQAEQALEESLSINPAQPGVIQHWVHIRQKACQWPIYKSLQGVSLAEMKRYTSPLAMLALTEDPAEQLLNSQSFVARTYSFREERLSQGCAYQHQRVRVGYVSADFREHAVGFLLPSMMDGHGATFELFAYDYSTEERTPLREHLKGQFDHFRSIKDLSDRQAAELILADEIDILIDLHGLSSGARPGIFALHPAPKQGTYLGFMGPTGMPWFDFVIADRHVLPDELAVYFTEKPLHVEGSYLPMVSYADSAPVLTRDSLGLPEGAFVMGAFGNTYKITPEMFDTWMRLLKRIPDALLWLVDDNESSTISLKAHAQAAGVGLDRLVFSSRTSHPEFFARLKLADVYLDTYPYNCGSTSNDVIHAGVPLVTMYGKTLVSRMGLSLMSALNSASNATRTYAEYEDKVVELAIKNKAGKMHVALPQGEPLRIGQALAQLRQPLSQASAEPSQAAPVRPGVQLFQICYSEETRQSIPAGFAELDNLDNERPDWREFWPMRNYLMNHALEENVFYGFFSPRFTYKTGLDIEKIREFAHQHGADHEVLIFSPFWDLNSLFINSFEQGEFFHPGLMACSQQFLQAVGKDLRLSELVMHGDNTAFCNYFIAKKRFWLHWLELGEKLYQSAEAEGTVLGHALNQNTIYSHDLLPQKIFVQERLVNMLLAGPEFKSMSRSWSMFGLPCSITPLSQYKSLAVTANALKMAYTHTGEALYLNEFHQLRDKVWKDSGIDQMAKARDQILHRKN